jgi:hypothetical protein
MVEIPIKRGWQSDHAVPKRYCMSRNPKRSTVGFLSVCTRTERARGLVNGDASNVDGSTLVRLAVSAVP